MKRLLVLIFIAALATPIAPSSAASVKTKLTIKADLVDGAGVRTWTLNCDTAGGNHPNKSEACAILKKRGTALFKPTPRDGVCTMIYGGDQKVTVSGFVAKKKVAATFTRVNGCEIARYEAAIALFTIPNTQVYRGTVLLDGVASAAPVSFTSGTRLVSTSATVTGFAIRLGTGTWLGSAGVGRSCAPVTLTVPSPDQELLISCTSPKS